MALTPETLPRHELVGLRVRVVDAANPDLVGIAGRVVRETTNTLVVEAATTDAKAGDADAGACEAADARTAADGESEGCGHGEPRAWQVPKQGTVFEFALTDETAGDREAPGIASEPADAEAGEGATYVTVDGARLLSRPATRTETRGRSTWR